MSEQSRPTKKQKIVPPCAPRVGNKPSTPRADLPRSESVPRVATGDSAAHESPYARATSAYPTLIQTARKSVLASDSFGSRATHMPAPAFQTVPQLYSELQGTGSPDMSDSGEDGEKDLFVLSLQDLPLGSKSREKSGSGEASEESSGDSSGDSGESSDVKRLDLDLEILEEGATGNSVSRGKQVADFETSAALEKYIANLRAQFTKQATREPSLGASAAQRRRLPLNPHLLPPASVLTGPSVFIVHPGHTSVPPPGPLAIPPSLLYAHMQPGAMHAPIPASGSVSAPAPTFPFHPSIPSHSITYPETAQASNQPVPPPGYMCGYDPDLLPGGAHCQDYPMPPPPDLARKAENTALSRKKTRSGTRKRKSTTKAIEGDGPGGEESKKSNGSKGGSKKKKSKKLKVGKGRDGVEELKEVKEGSSQAPFHW
ncbi:hypothetical protein BDV93DRAFT_562318 [Ceratobasidium sp. AG-I]|nr:hypothetical protein BDV93DRAFT_562318 [Ceratobasidium sp. AG-I]